MSQTVENGGLFLASSCQQSHTKSCQETEISLEEGEVGGAYLDPLWCISEWYVLTVAPPHLVYHHGNIDGEASAVMGGAGISPSQHFIEHSPNNRERERVTHHTFMK